MRLMQHQGLGKRMLSEEHITGSMPQKKGKPEGIESMCRPPRRRLVLGRLAYRLLQKTHSIQAVLVPL